MLSRKNNFNAGIANELPEPFNIFSFSNWTL